MAEPVDAPAQRQRALRRRVLLATLGIIGFIWILWDVWEVPLDVFVDALIGITFMIVVAVVVGAGLGALISWLRRSPRDD